MINRQRAGMESLFAGLGAVSNAVLGYLQQKKEAELKRQQQSAYVQAFQQMPELQGIDPQLLYTMTGGNAPAAMQTGLELYKSRKPTYHFRGTEYPQVFKETPAGIENVTPGDSTIPEHVRLSRQYGNSEREWQAAIANPAVDPQDKALMQSALEAIAQRTADAQARASALVEGRTVRSETRKGFSEAAGAGVVNENLGKDLARLEQEKAGLMTKLQARAYGKEADSQRARVRAIEDELSGLRTTMAKNLGEINSYWLRYGYKWDNQGKLYKVNPDGTMVEVDKSQVDLENPPHKMKAKPAGKPGGKSVGRVEILSIEDDLT